MHAGICLQDLNLKSHEVLTTSIWNQGTWKMQSTITTTRVHNFLGEKKEREAGPKNKHFAEEDCIDVYRTTYRIQCSLN